MVRGHWEDHLGHLSDVYLLGLAVHHHGRLATFDQSIPTAVVIGGARALEVVPA